jgi:hypothetical protein
VLGMTIGVKKGVRMSKCSQKCLGKRTTVNSGRRRDECIKCISIYCKHFQKITKIYFSVTSNVLSRRIIQFVPLVVTLRIKELYNLNQYCHAM